MANDFTLPPKAIIGMIHVHATPASPFFSGNVQDIVTSALQDARILMEGGCNALLIENMHDRPHLLGNVGPEVVAMMTAVGCAIRDIIDLPLGVQVLCGANEEAIAVAQACKAQFIRADAFVFSHISNAGITTQADAGPLLRYRKQISAGEIAIFADIKKKHGSHAITADLSIGDIAREAEYFGADGVIVTGASTGLPTNPDDVKQAKEQVFVPVLVGSGVSPENIASLWPHADAFIVGSYLKHEGDWRQPVDPRRVEALMRVTHKEI
ncbi:MAG: BtpA/SgcQ family protein [Chlamydiales bacterium]|nr:BtpA/SgcQ family protein [Chlamydiales bacterium]